MKLLNFECAHLIKPTEPGGRDTKNDIGDNCIVVDGVECDLHNNYEFIGYSHDVKARTVTMNFQGGFHDEHSTEYDRAMPDKLSIRFDGVWEFTVEPRDPAYPPESDLGLMSLYLSDVDYTHVTDIPDWPEEARANICLIDLESEQKFQIYAESAEAILG